MKSSTYTLQQLLNEIKSTTPSFKVGQLFETLKSIYPDVKVPKKEKNITYKDISFTKPLASSKKAKQTFLKEKSPVADFFKDTMKGDFLQVVELKDKKAYCVNLSLKESIRNKFYKNDFIVIDYSMVANGTVKPHKRKNIQRYFTEEYQKKN